MLNRWSVLLLAIGVVTGYAAAGTSVRAQDEALPFAVGETIELQYESAATPGTTGYSVDCVVAEIRGNYVRCGSARFAAQRFERWRSLKRVSQIVKKRE